MSNRCFPLWAVALACVAALAAPSEAHVGALEARVPYVVGDVVVGAGTTWGVTLEENGSFLRTCDEATEGITQFTAKTTSAVLVGTTEGLYRTEVGCALTPIEALFGVPFLSAQADDPDVLAIVAADAGTTRLYYSVDGGESFALWDERADFSALSVAISRAGDRVVVAGYNALVAPEIYAVRAEGAERLPLTFDAEEAPSFINVVGTDEQATSERFALALITPAQASTLALLDIDALLAGDPQSDALVEVAAFDDVVTHFASTSIGRAVLLNRRTFLSQLGETAFKPEAAGPTRCLGRRPGADAMMGCGTDESGEAIGTSVDGREWEWSIPFVDVVDRLCPAGTIGRYRCAYLFPDLDAGPIPEIDAGSDDAGAGVDAGATDAGSDGGGDVDGGTPQDAGAVFDAGPADGGIASDGGGDLPPRTCGCDATDGSRAQTGLWASLVLVLSWRRRWTTRRTTPPKTDVVNRS